VSIAYSSFVKVVPVEYLSKKVSGELPIHNPFELLPVEVPDEIPVKVPTHPTKDLGVPQRSVVPAKKRLHGLRYRTSRWETHIWSTSYLTCLVLISIFY
jgi:hypothetical protein